MFKGCVRRLEINNKVYNFNATSAGGDTIGGIDVGKGSRQLKKRAELRKEGTRISASILRPKTVQKLTKIILRSKINNMKKIGHEWLNDLMCTI